MRSKQVQILSGICGVQLIGYVCRAAGFKADIWIGVAGSVYPVCHYETEETFPGTFAKEWRLAYKP